MRKIFQLSPEFFPAIAKKAATAGRTGFPAHSCISVGQK
jgi:hypothetical protein